jgi:large subunit ribosomal protein L23
MGLFKLAKKSKTPETDVNIRVEDKKSESLGRETSKSVKSASPKAVATTSKTSATNLASVLIRPRITEKATILSEKDNVYTFDVDPRTTKQEVAKAILNHYKVKPIKVNISDIKRKRVIRRGKKGIKAGGKKAMVYLKKGDKIEFV